MTDTVSTSRERELAENLAAVRERLAAAAEAAGRAVDEIELLPVTKFFPAADVIVFAPFRVPGFWRIPRAGGVE